MSQIISCKFGFASSYPHKFYMYLLSHQYIFMPLTHLHQTPNEMTNPIESSKLVNVEMAEKVQFLEYFSLLSQASELKR